jgi:hypothetical protein
MSCDCGVENTGLWVRQVNAKDEGGCNFCGNNTYSVVFLVGSLDRNLVVRFCYTCMRSLKWLAK